MITDWLNTWLSHKPELTVTNAKTYIGKIWAIEHEGKPLIDTEHPCRIFLSQYNARALGELELVDTICHELAHIEHWEHTEEHKELTKTYRTRAIEAIQALLAGHEYFNKFNLKTLEHFQNFDVSYNRELNEYYSKH